ncbi:MAG: peptide MFS transporter [Weeksellaceae bacterium]|nr:peptide MFS transporter [Weeksellaceae bacterium]
MINKKVHPRALFALFMVELWERFSYYGMRTILILYLTSELVKGGFGYDDGKAYGIYGAYGALVYLTPILGGWFADKMMGFRKAILWGALLMAAGQFTLFLNNEVTFYIGLALLVIGNGFFKPNISSMIGKFYPEGDPRRDGAFTIFYMGINIGAFLTPLTCGAIGEIEGWKWGFFAAGVGMMLGYFIFLIAQARGWFENYGLRPEEEMKPVVKGVKNSWLPYVFSLLMVPIAWFLINQNDIVDILLAILAVVILGFLIYQSFGYETVQKHRIWVVVILLLFTTVFWTFFELAGSAMNIFTERNVNKNLLGMNFTTTFFQSVNPLFIMIFAPIFSWMWIKLGKSGKEPAAPYKFGTGLVLLGLGFLVMTLGKGYAVAGLVPAMFLIFLYLLHTLGELTLSPVGLSLVTKLAPVKIVAFLMGIWFLSSSIAHQAGKHIAKLTTVSEAKIMEEQAFKENIADPYLLSQLETEGFRGQLESSPVEKALVSDSFLQQLNENSQDRRYAKKTIQIEELKAEADAITQPDLRQKMLEDSKRSFLVYADDLGNQDELISALNANQMAEATLTGSVLSSLRGQSLMKGLSVFQNLGFIAVGCGLLLFLLGPIITRWMHGIK